jgi:hypothetical protein
MPIAEVTEQTYVRKNLRGGSDEIKTNSVTIGGGQGVLADLTVLAVANNGKAVAHNPASVDAGTKIAKFILPHGFDTTSGDKVASVYVAGCFNPNELIWNVATNSLLLQQAAFSGSPISIRKPLART